MIKYKSATIRSHDSIQDIAERYLGDSSKWFAIATLNRLRSPYISDDPQDQLGQENGEIYIPSVLPKGSTYIKLLKSLYLSASPDQGFIAKNVLAPNNIIFAKKYLQNGDYYYDSIKIKKVYFYATNYTESFISMTNDEFLIEFESPVIASPSISAFDQKLVTCSSYTTGILSKLYVTYSYVAENGKETISAPFNEILSNGSYVAEYIFVPTVSVITGRTGTLANGSLTRITATNTAGMIPGMTVTTTGGTATLAENTTIVSVDSATEITITPAATIPGSPTFSVTTDVTGRTGTLADGSLTRITATNTVGMIPGMTVTTTGGTATLAANTTIVSVDSATQITITPAAVAAGSTTFKATVDVKFTAPSVWPTGVTAVNVYFGNDMLRSSLRLQGTIFSPSSSLTVSLTSNTPSNGKNPEFPSPSTDESNYNEKPKIGILNSYTSGSKFTFHEPFFDDTYVLKTGDIIRIPINSLSGSIDNYYSNKTILDSYGKDISLNTKGQISFTGNSSTDILNISGRNNVIQSLNNRLLTRYGSLRAFPNYGNNSLKYAGSKYSATIVKSVKDSLINSIISDPRVQSIITIDVRYDADSSAIIADNIYIKLIEDSSSVSLSAIEIGF